MQEPLIIKDSNLTKTSFKWKNEELGINRVLQILRAFPRHGWGAPGPKGFIVDDYPPMLFCKKVGQWLYKNLDKDIQKAIESHLEKPTSSLRIVIDSTEKNQVIPWEYLYAHKIGFLALDPHFSIIRSTHSDIHNEISPASELPKIPLTITPVAVSPDSEEFRGVDPNHHLVKIFKTVSNSACFLPVNGIVVPSPSHLSLTIEEFEETLAKSGAIVHLAMHGAPNKVGVYFHNREGEPVIVEADKFLSVFNKCNVEVVVLIVCGGASARKFYGQPISLARLLANSKNCWVIASLFDISSEVADLFTTTFYSSLASGDSLELAIVRARKNLFKSMKSMAFGAFCCFAPRPESPSLNFIKVSDDLSEKELHLKEVEAAIKRHLKQWQKNGKDIAFYPIKEGGELLFITNSARLLALNLEEKIFLLAGCIYLGNNEMVYWAKETKDEPSAIDMIISILKSPFNRPRWRSAMILQEIMNKEITREKLEELLKSCTDNEIREWARRILDGNAHDYLVKVYTDTTKRNDYRDAAYKTLKLFGKDLLVKTSRITKSKRG